MSVLFAILLFSLLIFVHELGHFLVAKLSRVRVNEFSMFMGPAIWKKRIGYLYYQIKSLFVSQARLARDYDTLAVAVLDSPVICERNGRTTPNYHERSCVEELADYSFEGVTFKCPKNYDNYLSALYGDYMELPPEGERENRHQIIEIDFGEE
jgi:hypothetical protein